MSLDGLGGVTPPACRPAADRVSVDTAWMTRRVSPALIVGVLAATLVVVVVAALTGWAVMGTVGDRIAAHPRPVAAVSSPAASASAGLDDASRRVCDAIESTSPEQQGSDAHLMSTIAALGVEARVDTIRAASRALRATAERAGGTVGGDRLTAELDMMTAAMELATVCVQAGWRRG